MGSSSGNPTTVGLEGSENDDVVAEVDNIGEALSHLALGSVGGNKNQAKGGLCHHPDHLHVRTVRVPPLG